MSLIRCCFEAKKPELPEFLDSFVQKCTVPPCCCGCCSALRPRYKRLVDNVFPVNADDGLVKSNMEKLTFYSVSSPEKLDRIGEYLYQKASKDINRKRYKLVEIAMEAMDLLLVACHAQTLNLFVESFLRMVQKLLEDSNATLQILATNSFVKFANIEEDTPSYHRRYDFFISKFSSMCHSNHDDRQLCTQLRTAGIRGLQGVIRKTVSDDLVENIWDRQHMEKIVPSLLFNMQTADFTAHTTAHHHHYRGGDVAASAAGASPASSIDVTASMSAATATSGHGVTTSSSAAAATADAIGGDDDDSAAQTATPPVLAESVLRELVSRASFTHIKSVLNPLLQHLDRHELWVPNQFAIHTFRIVMISIQPQYSYTVVETLMQHLDQNMKAAPRTKTSLAVVLSKIIAIAAGESVGPSALDIINNLLTHLRTSTLLAQQAADGGVGGATSEEDQYQEALINALGEFANHHPDYQKIEIMLFIMNTVPDVAKSGPADLRLQLILLRSLRRVSVQYRTIHFEKAFPASFRQPLLRMARAPHGEIRAIVMQILQALLDRHDNQAEVVPAMRRMMSGGGGMSAVAVLAELSLESATRSDIMFARKHGAMMMQALIDAMALDDTVEALSATMRTAALMVLELGCGETVQEFLLFVLGIERLAITMPPDTITYAHRCNLHTVAITLFALLAHVTGVNNLRDYCTKLCDARAEDAPHWAAADLLEASASTAAGRHSLQQPHLYIDQLALVECLQNADMESVGLANGQPFVLHQIDGGAGHRQSWVDTASVSMTAQRSGRTSIDDITTAGSLNGGGGGGGSSSAGAATDLDSSVNSSPVLPRRQAITVELNFDAMKRSLAEPTDAAKREQRERHAQIGRSFREATFEELVRRTEPKHEMLQNRLNDLFTALAVERQIQAQTELKGVQQQQQQQQQQAGGGASSAIGGVGVVGGLAGGRERPIYENSFPELFYY